jgi:hypothetical protein
VQYQKYDDPSGLKVLERRREYDEDIERMTNLFIKIDTNQDQKLSLQELSNFLISQEKKVDNYEKFNLHEDQDREIRDVGLKI